MVSEVTGSLKKAEFERRAAEMRNRYMRGHLSVPLTSTQTEQEKLSLAEAARQLGVSYSTARRLLKNEPDVLRYSTTTAGTSPVYPGTPLKRRQRVRMTYVVPESVVVRLKKQMGGEQAA